MKNKICIISLVTMIIIAISTTSFGFGLNMSFNKIDKINVGDEIILTINFSEDIIGATLKINYDNNNLELLGSQTDDLTVANKDGKVSCVYFEIVKRGTNTLKVKFKVKSITNNIMSFNMEDAKFVTKLNEKTYTQNKEIKASITINKGDNSENDNTTKDDTNKDNNSNDDTKQDNSSEDNNTSNDDVNKDDNSNNSNDNKTPDKDISDDNNGDIDDIPDTDIDDDKNNIDDDTDDDLQDDTNKDNTTNDNKKNNNSNSEMIDNNNDNNTSNNNGENKDNNLNDNNNVKNNNTNQNNVKNNNSNTTNTNNIKGNDLTNSKSNTKDNNSNNKTVSIKNMPFTGTYAILYIAIVLAVIVTIVAGLRIKTKAKDFEDKYDK